MLMYESTVYSSVSYPARLLASATTAVQVSLRS